MNNGQFTQQLIQNYDENDINYGNRTNEAIEKWFAAMPQTSKDDPTRLGTRSVFICKLRNQLIEMATGVEYDSPLATKFNKMTLKEQLTFQKKSEALGENKWVHGMKILPENIDDIQMSPKDIAALKARRNTSDLAKLREPTDPIDVGKLSAILLPALSDPEAKLNAQICALLLATGRRTIEVLKTGDFYLAPDMDSTGYFAMFKGQAKASLFGTEDYKIPLLAPFYMCRAALDRIQNVTLPVVKDLSTDKANNVYARGVGNYLKQVTKLDLVPHDLRSLYAMSQYKLLENKRPSLIGFISRILGQTNAVNASYYQCIAVENVSLWTAPVQEEFIDDLDGWIADGAAERKRLAGIREMMLYKKKITISAVKRMSGGTNEVIERVMNANADRINQYNKSL